MLKRDRVCVSFCGWSKIDRFMAAWRAAWSRPVGHLVFRKRYASSSRFLRYEHEQAYLHAKGSPAVPTRAIPDVSDMRYSGNVPHPTQKPVSALRPLVEAFSTEGETVPAGSQVPGLPWWWRASWGATTSVSSWTLGITQSVPRGSDAARE
jgi:adenine-specific DNA-methyltransferase